MRQHLGDPARHFFMTRSVAKVMGLNLTEAIQAGDLDPTAYAGMVTACRGCALVEACEEWLSGCGGCSPTPPPGCCNAALLTRLQQVH
ncbi:MAG: DUF6455 family protein [Pelagimonas sp.]|jgi:hypothetical protein|nr:DUF6455 family protein [Pelagimonas sp.]